MAHMLMQLMRPCVRRASFLYAVSVPMFDDFVHVYAVLAQLYEDGVQKVTPKAYGASV